MIEIDGSMMEGGGQLLRMSITYSAILGAPVKVNNIRASRENPGLRPQHLATLRAVGEICDADIRGLSIGSREVEFKPRGPRGGSYAFDIGTAGSVSLLLQCVAPVAAFADSETMMKIVGGTAVLWSPPVTALGSVLWMALGCMGFEGKLVVLREGFYPKGGGVVEAKIPPVEEIKPLILEKPDRVSAIKGLSFCGRLPEHVAERQARTAEAELSREGYGSNIERRTTTRTSETLSPGSYICLWAETTPQSFMGADSLGARGKPAERVGSEAAASLVGQLRTGASVDRHTADSLVIWCSLAEGDSSFVTSELTQHTTTAVELARIITGAKFEVDGVLGRPAHIRCRGISFKNRGQ